jgi:hypothetical protein
MKLTRKHFAGVAAAVSTVAVAAPMATASTASAASPFPLPGLYGAGWGAGWGNWGALGGIPTTGPVLGQGVTVVGPVIITTAPSNFNNTNNQVSAAGNWAGGQVGSG